MEDLLAKGMSRADQVLDEGFALRALPPSADLLLPRE